MKRGFRRAFKKRYSKKKRSFRKSSFKKKRFAKKSMYDINYQYLKVSDRVPMQVYSLGLGNDDVYSFQVCLHPSVITLVSGQNRVALCDNEDFHSLAQNYKFCELRGVKLTYTPPAQTNSNTTLDKPIRTTQAFVEYGRENFYANGNHPVTEEVDHLPWHREFDWQRPFHYYFSNQSHLAKNRQNRQVALQADDDTQVVFTNMPPEYSVMFCIREENMNLNQFVNGTTLGFWTVDYYVRFKIRKVAIDIGEEN